MRPASSGQGGNLSKVDSKIQPGGGGGQAGSTSQVCFLGGGGKQQLHGFATRAGSGVSQIAEICARGPELVSNQDPDLLVTLARQ